MNECWLRSNRRPLYAALALAAGLFVSCGVGTLMAWRSSSLFWAVVAALPTFGAALWAVILCRQLRTQRVSYIDGKLLIHDGSREPHVVPIDVVEAFFLGSGPATTIDNDDTGPRTANVVIRIAESAEGWQQGNLAPAIGRWSEGYIVLRGTWCEPIGHERLNVINHRLAEVRRDRRQQAPQEKQVAS